MQEIDSIIQGFVDELDYEPIRAMFANVKQGKRLRSKLILAIAQGVLGENLAENSVNLGENSRKNAENSQISSENSRSAATKNDSRATPKNSQISTPKTEQNSKICEFSSENSAQTLENSQISQKNSHQNAENSQISSKNSQNSQESSLKNQILKLCAIVEFIHLASLLHDDIIDEAQLRRGARSINAEFGAKNALMLGDILYSYAFCELSRFPKFVAYTLSRAVARLAKGELMDIELSKAFNADESAYLAMIELKTAALIEASASCAAHLVGLDEQKFAEYGRNLGLAFQIIDDILDIKSDEKTLGKPALSDFKEGKCTLCYIALFRELNYNDRQILQNLFKKELNSAQKSWLEGKFSEHKIIEKSLQSARECGLRAIKAVESVKNRALEDIVRKMIDREF